MAAAFPRCPECGGRVELTARAGRTRELVEGMLLEVPSDAEIPTCTVCGEESMTAEISEVLDVRLAALIAGRALAADMRHDGAAQDAPHDEDSDREAKRADGRRLVPRVVCQGDEIDQYEGDAEQ